MGSYRYMLLKDIMGLSLLLSLSHPVHEVNGFMIPKCITLSRV